MLFQVTQETMFENVMMVLLKQLIPDTVETSWWLFLW